jgi:hypothetical protein
MQDYGMERRMGRESSKSSAEVRIQIAELKAKDLKISGVCVHGTFIVADAYPLV